MDIAALVLSFVASGFAAWVALLRPSLGAAQIRQLRREVAELADDVEQMHALHHKRARRENVELAREGKAKKSALVEEAESILASAAAAVPPSASNAPQQFDKAAARRVFLHDGTAH